MTEDTTQYLAIAQVDDESLADVTLKGDEEDIFELKESLDLNTLLQRELDSWESELNDVDVEVIPRNGLQGFDN